MTLTRHRSIEHVERTTASEASREMARPANGEVDSFYQEYEKLKQEVTELDAQLGGYSQAAFLKEQQRVRRESGGRNDRSLDAWINRKSEMENERLALVRKKMAKQSRMSAIKVRALEEKRSSIPKTAAQQEVVVLWTQVLDELRAIRKLLESK